LSLSELDNPKLEEDFSEMGFPKLDDPPPSFELGKEEKVDNLTPSKILDLKESQDEEDIHIILHVETIDRKSGKNVPFFISLLTNDFTLHNCMLDLGASTNVMPSRVM
jgi:hypothetical protein